MAAETFKVGDRVECIKPMDGLHTLVGKKGTVVYIRHSNRIGVEFDHEFSEGHSCDGKGKEGQCRYGDENEIKKIGKSKKKTMQKVSTMMKKLLDKDVQTLVKAGFIDGDLDLTDVGEQALLAILFTTNKGALVKEAQEQIDEEEKDKA